MYGQVPPGNAQPWWLPLDMAWKPGWEFLDSPWQQLLQVFLLLLFLHQLGKVLQYEIVLLSTNSLLMLKQRRKLIRIVRRWSFRFVPSCWPWLLLWGSSSNGPAGHNSWAHARCWGNAMYYFLEIEVTPVKYSRECPNSWVIQESKSCGVSIGQ